MNIFEKAARIVHTHKIDLRQAIDRWVLHKFFGYVILALVFYAFFHFIFGIGELIEAPLIKSFDRLNNHLESLFASGSLSLFLVHGVLHGISGGIAIVLPYLVPFLIGLSLLEDVATCRGWLSSWTFSCTVSASTESPSFPSFWATGAAFRR